MNSIELVTFLLLGMAAVVFKSYNRTSLVDFLQLMFFASIALLIKDDLSSEVNGAMPSQVVFGLIGVGAINLVISKWKGYHRPYIRVIPPLITFSAFWIFFESGNLSYLSNSFELGSMAIIALPFLGALAYEFGNLKTNLISKLFDTKGNLANVVSLFVLAVALLVGVFNAGGFGVLLVAIGHLSASFFREKEEGDVTTSLMAISLIWMFSGSIDGVETEVSLGKTLMGLFVGVGIVGMIKFSWTSKKRKFLLVFTAYLISAGFVILLLLLNLQHNAFGGVEAFIGVVIGFALANVLIGKPFVGMSLLAIIVVAGLHFPSYLINDEQLQIEKELEIFEKPDAESDEADEVSTLPIGDISGSYKIEEKTALISFQLGPKGGVTKGAIKGFSGTVNIGEDLLESSFSVNMPIANLTTFNKMRDDVLNGADYFNSKKFGKMTFSANGLKSTAVENHCELTGEFNLLGKIKEVTITIMRLDDESNILIGKGSLDRTLFGMTPDTRQGNVVSFEFKINLI